MEVQNQPTNTTPNSPQGKNNAAIITGVIVVILLILGITYASMRKSAPATDTAAQPTPVPTAMTEVTPTPTPTSSSPNQINIMPTETPSPTPTPTPSAHAGLKTFTVTGQNFSFSPAQIKVKKGDMIKIVFVSSGGSHNWVLDKYNVKTNTISAGQTDTIEFTADKTGTFEYYCSVANHRAMGMKGTLVVQ